MFGLLSVAFVGESCNVLLVFINKKMCTLLTVIALGFL